MRKLLGLILTVSCFLAITLQPQAQSIPLIPKLEPCLPTRSGINPHRIVQGFRIPSGAYAGGFIVGSLYLKLNWYFANIGLIGFVECMPNDIRTYLDLYLAYVQENGLIDDVEFRRLGDFQSLVKVRSDSDDSYAATFLSLAFRYVQVSLDFDWVRQNISKLRLIANKNLLQAQLTNGLVSVRQNIARPPVAYLQDNTEVYRGLSDFAMLLTKIGDTSSFIYANAAKKVANGILEKMYFQTWVLNCPQYSFSFVEFI
jgi:hypothetical protein